jgi:hypothetical protein
MTEEQWLACTDSASMPGFLCFGLKVSRTKRGRRKLRLYACACCRRAWHLLPDERDRRALEVAERFADGAASNDELESTWREMRGLVTVASICGRVSVAAAQAPSAAVSVLAWDADRQTKGAYHPAYVAEHAVQANIVRDVFGNPFRSATIDPTWLTPTAMTLAQAAYNERRLPSGELDPPRLAVLSDALEEAGCTDADILSHLRSPGPHVRGCWALDLILGKSETLRREWNVRPRASR